MNETVAPTGYYCITTVIRFSVDKDGKVSLITTEVNNDGNIKLVDGNNIVLADAPLVKEEYQPKKTDKVLDKHEPKVKGANTGDNNLIVIWSMILILSICAIALAAIKRRRETR